MRIYRPADPNDWERLVEGGCGSIREIKIIKERFANGRNQLRSEGRWFLGGEPPYGWKVKCKNLIPDPHESKVFKLMVKLRKKC